MSKILLLVITALAIGALLMHNQKPALLEEAPVKLSVEFEQFMKTYNRRYSGDELNYRREVFEVNLLEIQITNSYDLGYKLGVNQFTDMTQEEFVEKMLMNNLPTPDEANTKAVSWDAPDNVDWRDKGVLTPIKNQGGCGSCWAFSTTGVLESTGAIFGKSLPSLSEQQLVDCCGKDGFQCEGCSGAWPEWALNWVKAKGITTEAAYPYKGVEGTCKVKTGDFKISAYTMLPAGDVDSLQNAIAIQPVSVCVDASTWSSYRSGIFSKCSSSQSALDHAVLAVGYTPTYWIVKNSWGTSWGEQGFIRLARGNTCGIALHAITTKL